MKKITLFIAFLAISIGAVWGQNGEAFTVSNSTITTGQSSSLPASITFSVSNVSPNIPDNNTGDFEYFNIIKLTANGDISGLGDKNVTLTVGTTQPDISGSTSVSNNVLTITTASGNNFKFSKNDETVTINIEWDESASLSNVTWNTSLTLYGSRAIKNHTASDGNTYTVHTGTLSSTLEKFAAKTSSSYFISFVDDGKKSDVATDVEGAYYDKYFTFSDFGFQVSSGVQNIKLTAIGNGAFDGYKVSANTAILFPATVTVIGSEEGENKCFKFDIETNSSGDNYKVMLIFGYSGTGMIGSVSSGGYLVPTFYSTDDTYANLVASGVTFALGPKAEFNFGGWSQSIGDGTPIVGKFSRKGKSWYPFAINVTDMHVKDGQHTGREVMTGAQKYIKIDKYPFDQVSLRVALTGESDGAHDGTWCDYYNIVKYNDGYSDYGVNAKYFEYTLQGLQKPIQFNVDLDYKNYLEYGKGQPFFNYTADYNAVAAEDNSNGSIMCFNSKSVTFKSSTSVDKNGDFVDNVPYWLYKNVTDAQHPVLVNDPPTSLVIDCPVYVEKVITNEHYRYFSLPFDCLIDSIDVRLLGSDGKPTGGALPLFKWDFDENGDIITNSGDDYDTGDDYDNGKDYFIINEYKGQQDGNNEGLPNYDIVKSGKLFANKGYAFAIVESDTHYDDGDELKALITFKSENAKNKLYLNTYNELTISVQCNNSNATLAQNKGWNMIGNPFYHYLKPNSFYGDDSESGTSHPIKYISLIDDNDNETVHHYWVNEQKNYSNPNGDNDEVDVATKIPYIKPFQAFFVQVSENCTTMTVYPKDADFTYQSSTPTEQENQAVSRIPAEEEEIQEHLSVKVTGQDGSFDRTTIINDETRDEHFKMMDDLSKIMNPGIQIYTWYDSVPCAFKELPMRADSTMAIPLGVRVEEAGNYTFALDTNLTFFYGAAMLHDKQMNQYHPLNEDGVQVSLTEGTDNARFELVIVPSEIPADVENVETSETLDAYVHDGRLVVENIEEGSTLSIFDVTGKMLYSAPAVSDFNYQFSAHGVYMVVLQGNTTGSIKVVY